MEPSDNNPVNSSTQHEDTVAHNRVELGGNKTIMCSVLFVDIVAYSRKSVSQQMDLKNCLNSAMATAISVVPVDDRIILDTGDGAAISFLSDIEDALKVALILRECLLEEGAQLQPPLLARMGINLGPVRLIKDINGQPNIVGDGINVAQRVMEFAEAGQILISRSYHDAISNLAQEYADMLRYHGKYTDKHVREHEVYSVSRNAEAGLPPQAAGNADRSVPSQSGSGMPGKFARLFRRASSQPRVLIAGIAVGILLLAAARMIKVGQSPQEMAASAPDNPPSASVPENFPAASKVESPQAATVAAVGMATVSFAITPWGEVYLDGNIQGNSPPLKTIQVAPGNHHIEIRNKKLPKYSQNFTFKAGEKKVIRFKFSSHPK